MTLTEHIAGLALCYWFEHKDMECDKGKKVKHNYRIPTDNLCIPCWSRVVLKVLAKAYGWKNLVGLVDAYREKMGR